LLVDFKPDWNEFIGVSWLDIELQKHVERQQVFEVIDRGNFDKGLAFIFVRISWADFVLPFKTYSTVKLFGFQIDVMLIARLLDIFEHEWVVLFNVGFLQVGKFQFEMLVLQYFIKRDGNSFLWANGVGLIVESHDQLERGAIAYDIGWSNDDLLDNDRGNRSEEDIVLYIFVLDAQFGDRADVQVNLVFPRRLVLKLEHDGAHELVDVLEESRLQMHLLIVLDLRRQNDRIVNQDGERRPIGYYVWGDGRVVR
jgi:hypothetical protein